MLLLPRQLSQWAVRGGRLKCSCDELRSREIARAATCARNAGIVSFV